MKPTRRKTPTRAEQRAAAEAHPILGEPKSGYAVLDLLHWIDTVPLSADETRFQTAVLKAAKALGLLCFHDYDSRRNESGFPDLVIVGWGGIAFWELKREDGEIRPAQIVWNEALSRIARLFDLHQAEQPGLIQVEIYRPSDWGIDGPMVKALARLARPPKGVSRAA